MTVLLDESTLSRLGSSFPDSFEIRTVQWRFAQAIPRAQPPPSGGLRPPSAEPSLTGTVLRLRVLLSPYRIC